MSNTQAPIYNAACCPSVRWSVRPYVVYSKSVSQSVQHRSTHSLNDVIAHFGWRYVNTTFLFMYGRLRCAWDVGMQKFYVKISIQSSNNSNTNQTNNSSIRLATKTNLLALLSDIHTPTRQPTRSSRERAKAATTSDDDDVYTHARVFNATEVMNERTNEWMKSCHKCKTHIFIDLLEQHYLLRCR